MEWAEIIGAIVIALVIGAIFYYGFKSTGPWGSFWAFFLVLFFIIWIAAIATDPYGPVYWGIAWFDFFIIGLLFALLLAAATPSRVDRRRYREYYTTTPEAEEEAGRTAVAIGVWFWAMIILFIIIALIIALV
ncbi:MAG: hypothetical protein ACNS60_04975 [Candidatus Cyclobacteriaceae bacterium M2_1C_046]